MYISISVHFSYAFNFMNVCSDGFWDVINIKKAVQLVQQVNFVVFLQFSIGGFTNFLFFLLVTTFKILLYAV